MGAKFYTLVRIEGEYAYIREDNSNEDIFIAMALLPLGVDIGTRLKYEDLVFEVVEKRLSHA